MKSKLYYIFGAALILALGIYFLSNYSKTETTTAIKEDQSTATEPKTVDQTDTQPASTATDQSKKQAPTAPEGTHYSNESDIEGNADVLVSEVDYDGNHFTPATLNIKVGDIVFFKNSSNKVFRPASNPHPTHTVYPEFDAKQNIAPGDTFQFKFMKVGKWGYHDHLNPSATGIINVTK